MSKESALLEKALSWMVDLSDLYADNLSLDDRIKLMLEAEVIQITEFLAQPELSTDSLQLDEQIEESPPYDMKIHDNPDALAWTRFFRETNPDCNVDDDAMLCWFANAMMAMHDHTYRKYSQPKREPLSEEATTDMFHASKKARIASCYWAGIRDAEKAHGIGGEE